MNYPDGTPVQIGDFIWWDGGIRVGFIQKIILNPEEIGGSPEDGPDVGISEEHPFDPESESWGFIYPLSCFEDEGIEKLSIAEEAQFRRSVQLANARSQTGFEGHVWKAWPNYIEDCFSAWTFTIFSNDLKTENGSPKPLETIQILHSEAT